MKTLNQSELIKYKFKSSLESSGFEVRFRSESRQLWEKSYELLEFQRISAGQSEIDYCIEYEQGNGRQCYDLSSILIVNQKPVAIWPLSISTWAESKYVARPGGVASGPYCLSSASNKLREKISKVCYRTCIELAKSLDQKEFLSSCFEACCVSGISPWQIYAMQLGASCSIKHEALVDLSPPIEEIKKNFRKSYKSLINQSEKIWSSCVVSQEKLPSIWNEFKDLHFTVSQRKTRSDRTWLIQQEAALNGEGFLVAVYKSDVLDQRLIGAGFFNVSKHEGIYSVGAYDRTLFDQPVSHIVQLRAIEELKKRDCHWYHIGKCDFPGDTPTPDKKALSISLFKSGFANHFSCSYELKHQLIDNITETI